MIAGTNPPAPHILSAHAHRADSQLDANHDIHHDPDALRAVEAALTSLTTDATHPPTPTMLFRVALSLRHDGYAAEADSFFRQSSRLLSEQYVNGRLRMLRPRVA